MNYESTLEHKHWLKDNALEYCYNLSKEQLTDSPLARLASDKGYSSLTSVLNEWDAWQCTVCEVDTMLRAPIDGE